MILGTVQTDNYGVFQFPDVEPGFYGLFVASSGGVGAMAIEFGGPSFSQNVNSNVQVNYVSTAEPNAYRQNVPSVSMAMIDEDAIGWLNNFVQQQAYQDAVSEPRPGTGPQGPTPNVGDFNLNYNTGGGGGGEFGPEFAAFFTTAAIISAIDSDRRGGGFQFQSPFRP